MHAIGLYNNGLTVKVHASEWGLCNASGLKSSALQFTLPKVRRVAQRVCLYRNTRRSASIHDLSPPVPWEKLEEESCVLEEKFWYRMNKKIVGSGRVFCRALTMSNCSNYWQVTLIMIVIRRYVIILMKVRQRIY